MAVGVMAEVDVVRRHFSGDVLVMAPMTMADVAAPRQPGVVRTVSHPDVLAALAARPHPPELVVELDSPVHRHGIEWTDLRRVAALLPGLPVRGVALHLPMGGRRLRVARDALAALADAGIRPPSLWVSHLVREELSVLADEAAPMQVRPRVGTALWL